LTGPSRMFHLGTRRVRRDLLSRCFSAHESRWGLVRRRRHVALAVASPFGLAGRLLRRPRDEIAMPVHGHRFASRRSCWRSASLRSSVLADEHGPCHLHRLRTTVRARSARQRARDQRKGVCRRRAAVGAPTPRTLLRQCPEHPGPLTGADQPEPLAPSLFEAALSFLGLGTQPPQPLWGGCWPRRGLIWCCLPGPRSSPAWPSCSRALVQRPRR